jgi:hypothetical protein
VAARDEARRRVRTPQAFVGATLGASLPALWYQAGTAEQLALRIGFVLSGIQVQLEVSPGTTVMTNVFTASSAVGLFDVAGSVGALIPITDAVFWILRIGGGAGLVFGLSSTFAFGDMRLDVTGVAIRASSHMSIELMVPSLRLMVPTSATSCCGNVFGMFWMTSVTLDYLF